MSEHLGWEYPVSRRPTEPPPPARKRQLEWDFPVASVWEYRYWQKIKVFDFLYPRDIATDGKNFRRLYRMFADNEADARLGLGFMVGSGNYKFQINFSTGKLVGLREADGDDVKVEDFTLQKIGRPENVPEWFPNRGDGASITDASGFGFIRYPSC